MSSKKLSLEERLSLAAKKGKKKSKKTSLNSASNESTPSPNDLNAQLESPTKENLLVISQDNELEKRLSRDDSDAKKSASYSEEPERLQEEKSLEPEESTYATTNEELLTKNIQADDIDIEDSMSLDFDENVIKKEWLPSDLQNCDIKSILNSLTPHIKDLNQKVQQLDCDNKLLSSELSDKAKELSDKTKSDSSLIKLIKEKEDIIAQLRKEGESLSKTELRKNNQIKSLKEEVKNLEEEVSSLERELSQVSEKRKEVEGKNSDLQKDIVVLREEIANVKKETSGRDEIESLLQQTTDDLNGLRQSYGKLENELLAEKENHGKELQLLRDASRDQINLLESKLEQYRIQLEKAENNINIGGNNTDSVEKSISQYQLLQDQFKQSKENWESIEFALNSKISDIQTTEESLKAANDNLKDELEHYKMKNVELGLQLSQTLNGQECHKKEVDQLKIEIKTLSSNLDDIKDEYSLLQKKYDIQRTQLQRNIKNEPHLTQAVSSNNDNNISKGIESSNGDEISINKDVMAAFEDDWQLPADSSYVSIPDAADLGLEGNKNNNNNPKLGSYVSLNDIPEEASPLNPLVKKRNSSVTMNTAFPRRVSSGQLLNMSSANNTSNNNINNNTNTSVTGQHMNAQLVNRLGAEVRRMEGELTSLRDSYSKLQVEKDSTNEEILKLIEQNDNAKRLESENKKLITEVTNLQAQLETSLQLLGEKTEHAEELENDVDDLKDMLQQQVQQMVQMQEQMR